MPARPLVLHPDRLFPSDPATRAIARSLYQSVKDLPIISPHGHTDPEWWATDAPFGNASELLLHPDHYVFRMLHSQGVPLEALGIRNPGADPRQSWRLFAERYHLFRGTPSRMWLDWVFAQSFGIEVQLGADTADHYFDTITAALATPAFRPRALFERYNIEVIATTEGPLDDLRHHQTIRDSGWGGRVITAYRPDAVIDPEFEGFRDNLARLGEITGEDCFSWQGYLVAHRQRRAFFAQMGATSTDHGHPSACTADLSTAEAEALIPGGFDVVLGFNYLHMVRDVPATLRRICALTAPGGLFISKTPCLGDMNPLLSRVALPLMRAVGKAPHVSVFGRDALCDLIGAAGFEILAVESHASRGKDHRPYIVARRR